MTAVLVARCENYREDLDERCTGRIHFRWGQSQAACDTCGAYCGIVVAVWERVEAEGARWDCTGGHPTGCVHVSQPDLPIAAPAGDDELREAVDRLADPALTPAVRLMVAGIARNETEMLGRELERLRARDAAPIDWPARFRAAAEAIDHPKYPQHVTHLLRCIAGDLERSGHVVVEAVGRALLGEVP